MVEIFNARTGKTVLYMPRLLALTTCRLLDKLTGEFHDYACGITYSDESDAWKRS